MKVIAIDDEISSLQIFLKEIVAIDNLECKFFKDDPQNILEYVKNNDVCSAFIDINMPKINGIELAKKLISIVDDIKIVFVTGISLTKSDLPPSIQNKVLGFIYKPYSYNEVKYYVDLLSDNYTTMEIKMFGGFDCFVNKEIVRFSSAKSKELFALLITYNGRALEMNDAISQLWPDAPLDNAKKLYRDAVWRLRKALNEYNFNCVIFSRAQLLLNKARLRCDYWDYLATGKGNYNGYFCKSYDWSIDYLAELDDIKNKH